MNNEQNAAKETTMFGLAEKLKSLRDRKKGLSKELQDLNSEIEGVDLELSELMAMSETQNFTRNGTMFVLKNVIHASATAGKKDELCATLKETGFGDLVYETVNANSLSAFVKKQTEENDGVLPNWLTGLVNVFEKMSVGVRKA